MSRLFHVLLTLTLWAIPILFTSTAHTQVVVPPKIGSPTRAESLINIIKATQKRYVRESWGERAAECFTDQDLERFYNSNTTQKIINDLRSDKAFLDVIQALRALPPVQRDELLDKAASTYKPTWAQIGKIDRSGQTDAGQQAEKEIATAIVKLARDLL